MILETARCFLENCETLLWKNIYAAANGEVLFNILVLCFMLICTIVLWDYMVYNIKEIHIGKAQKSVDEDFIYNTEECPICINDFTTPVRLQCGHVYCLECVVTYFESNNFKWKCICPLCKRLAHEVTSLSDYTTSELNSKDKADMQKKLHRMIRWQKCKPILVCIHLMQNQMVKMILVITATTMMFFAYLTATTYVIDVSIYKKMNMQIKDEA